MPAWKAVTPHGGTRSKKPELLKNSSVMGFGAGKLEGESPWSFWPPACTEGTRSSGPGQVNAFMATKGHVGRPSCRAIE